MVGRTAGEADRQIDQETNTKRDIMMNECTQSNNTKCMPAYCYGAKYRREQPLRKSRPKTYQMVNIILIIVIGMSSKQGQ